MLALAFLHWWYGPGYRHLVRSIGERITGVLQALSVPILIQTLFSPWRRIITYGNRSFVEGMKAALDNLISRLVGFVVRSFVIIAALVGVVVVGLLGLAAMVIWPFAPILGIILIIVGLLPW